MHFRDPGVEPGPLAVKVQSPNHWTARESPEHIFLRDAVQHSTDGFYSQAQEELKSLLMKVKEESEKVGLKLNI